MKHRKYQLLSGVVAAHSGGVIVGRTRLQKTMKLLQSIGLPTNYGFRLHFYGPYSEDIQSDVLLLEGMNEIEEEEKKNQDGNIYYVMRSKHAKVPAEVQKLERELSIIAELDGAVLELAATYDAYRDLGHGHEEALVRVKRKKSDKATETNLAAAMKALSELHLLDVSPAGSA